MTKHKHCKRCDIVKAVTEFAKNKGRNDGLNSFCKACNKVYQKEYHAIKVLKESRNAKIKEPIKHDLTLDLENEDTLNRFGALVEGVNVCMDYMQENNIKDDGLILLSGNYLQTYIDDKTGAIKSEDQLKPLSLIDAKADVLRSLDDEYEYSEWLDDINPDWYMPLPKFAGYDELCKRLNMKEL